jgi:ABC-type proline/glycine betaine transport system permease subunit
LQPRALRAKRDAGAATPARHFICMRLAEMSAFHVAIISGIHYSFSENVSPFLYQTADIMDTTNPVLFFLFILFSKFTVPFFSLPFMHTHSILSAVPQP